MQFYNVPLNYNFLESLQRFLVTEIGRGDATALADVTVLLPSRRVATALRFVFLQHVGNGALLLPRLVAINDLDLKNLPLDNVDSSFWRDYLQLNRFTTAVGYKLLLLRRVSASLTFSGMGNTLAATQKLLLLLREMDSYEINGRQLGKVDGNNFSAGWQQILNFLEGFLPNWQDFLKKINLTSPETTLVNNVNLWARILENKSPSWPLVAAGNFAYTPSNLRLLRSLQLHTNTFLIFRAAENLMERGIWDTIDEFHSHFYLREIFKDLQIPKSAVKNIVYPDLEVIPLNICHTLQTAFLPSCLTYRWQHNEKILAPHHIKYLEFSDTVEELNVLLFYLTNYIAENGPKNIAIVVNADQVDELELLLQYRQIPYNNVYGCKFITNPVIRYLFLLLDVYSSGYALEYLLDLLKHGFTNLGYTPDELTALEQLWEKYVLCNGINIKEMTSYRRRVAALPMDDDIIRQQLTDFLDRIEDYFKVFAISPVSLKELMAKHLKLFQQITGAADLSSSNAEIFSFFEEEFLPWTKFFGDVTLEEYRGILGFLVAEKSYSKRCITYPAVDITSLQAVALLNYDLVLMPHLNDDTIFTNISGDPWTNIEMRRRLGLPPVETEIGKIYFDFLQLISQKEVVLTRSRSINGVIATESRLLKRLKTLLGCNNLSLSDDSSLLNAFRQYWYQPYDKSNDFYKVPPEPKPPLEARPRILAVTSLDLLNSDPYSFYVKKILHLSPRRLLPTNNIYAFMGTLLHHILEIYNNCSVYYRQRPEALVNFVENLLDTNCSNLPLLKFYREKILKILQQFILWDEENRQRAVAIEAETWHSRHWPEKNFTLTAKIDRWEIHQDGGVIIDYKTGTAPTGKDVSEGRRLQLPLEALVMANSPDGIQVKSLQYWVLKHQHSKILTWDNISYEEDFLQNLIKSAEDLLLSLVDFFDDPAHGYLAQGTIANDFVHLSRREEWQ
jgi:ATP-dependent helicase/nuclease subunit B